MISNRKHERFIKRLETEFSSENLSYRGISSDLSYSGMFIRTKNPFAKDTVIDIILHLPDGTECKLKGKVGDAARFCDLADPMKGLMFDGRITENFKLSTGTWVHVGTLRLALISAGAPVIEDCVITGHDRDEIRALVFPTLAGCRSLCPHLPADAPASALMGEPAVRQALADGLKRLAGEGPKAGSGHLLALDKHTTGDGIVSALQVLQAVQHSGGSLADLLREVTLFPQTLINVRLSGMGDWRQNARLVQASREVLSLHHGSSDLSQSVIFSSFVPNSTPPGQGGVYFPFPC